MQIFSMALGQHDHNTYDGVFHNQIERYSRVKHNVGGTAQFYDEYFKPEDHEIFAFTTTKGGIEEAELSHRWDLANTFGPTCLDFKPEKLWDYCQLQFRPHAMQPAHRFVRRCRHRLPATPSEFSTAPPKLLPETGCR